MSLEILEKVKEFLIRLVKDEDFRTQLMSEQIDEVKKVIEDSGYNFSSEEFETAAIKILELKELGEFHELSEEELVGAVGGIGIRRNNSTCKDLKELVLLKKNIIKDDIYRQLKGIQIQPVYGVVIPGEQLTTQVFIHGKNYTES